MTNEQIKQNAEEYAKKHAMDMRDLDILRRAYFNGAHSRDEEVKILKKAVSSTQKAMADLVEICHSKTDEIKQLQAELAKVKGGNV